MRPRNQSRCLLSSTCPPSSGGVPGGREGADHRGAVGSRAEITRSPLVDSAKAVLEQHVAGCHACDSAMDLCDEGDPCVVALCPDGRAVLEDILRLRLGRSGGSPALVLA